MRAALLLLIGLGIACEGHAPGTYVLALATDNRAYSRQSAERFNVYLERRD